MTTLLNGADKARLHAAWYEIPHRTESLQIAIAIYRETFELESDADISLQAGQIGTLIGAYEDDPAPLPWIRAFGRFLEDESARRTKAVTCIRG